MIKDAAVGGLSRAAGAGRRGDLGVASSLPLKARTAGEMRLFTQFPSRKVWERGQNPEPRVSTGGVGRGREGGPGAARVPPVQDPLRPLPAAHLALDTSPVFRSGFPAPWTWTPWLVSLIHSLSVSVFLSSFSTPYLAK